uniref:Uncharacterized protein n=1 Tax=Oryza barthii TaxID=65489 RepID=A0A0D3H3U5_9ORYZ
MSVLGGCRILQDTPSPFHVHRGQGHLAQTLFLILITLVGAVLLLVLDKQHHERFHSPGITSSVDMFCSLSPVLLSFLHFFQAHGFRSDQNHGCMIRSIDIVLFSRCNQHPLLCSHLNFLLIREFTEAGKRNRRIYCIQLSDRVLMDASGDGATGMMSCSPSLIWPEMHELNCRWAV